MAAALLINHMNKFTVHFTQADYSGWQDLQPGTAIMFAWPSFVRKREFVWSCGATKEEKNGLFKDKIDEFQVGPDQKAYWVSFLHGRQRMVLFTEDLAIATVAQEAYELERIQMQITLSFQGMGISLVNNLNRSEISYISITSSGTIWESKKNKRFKPLSFKECAELEKAFTKFTTEKAAGKDPKSRLTIDKLDVDLDEMKMYKPGNRDIRRSFQTGLWLQFRSSPHQLQLHAKIHRMQVDNQLPACVFPVVFAPVPPPKSIAAESIPKPFTEVSFMMRKAEHSNIPQIKYFKVLIQEMDVRADQGFINALLELFAGDELNPVGSPELYEKDVAIVGRDLTRLAQLAASTGEKTYYDMLHFSPLMVHLSFSQGGSSAASDSSASAKKPQPIPSTFFSVLLKSVGVTVTEIQDVVFKLAYFERESVFLNQTQLQAAVVDHYTKQAIKQFYVLVLGLDVIGNPFGLIRNLGEGVQDLFYEPVQGAIQGPEEFAEGLALGVRSLFGHAVGGAAGAVGRITGTLGKGIAALTMDEDYQRKRQEAINRRPKTFHEGMAQSGKGLVQGVFDGVTGVFVKPLEGAQQEGAMGFAKGMGKGLIGLVARPAAGVVDFASGSLDAVKRVVTVGEENKRIRAPRYVHTDNIIRPYNAQDAEGNAILHGVDKGKFASTDGYLAHAPVSKEKKFIFIATDHRALMASKSDLFGNYDCDWQFTWEELAEEPSVVEKGLQLLLKEPKKKKLGIFGSGSSGKIVHIKDPKVAQWLQTRCAEAYQKAVV